MKVRASSQGWILGATILGSSLVFIDGTVVSIALPTIQRGFGASASAAQWVVEAYTLVLGALMLLCGALGDRYGRKRLFLLGTIVFAVGSVVCGLAPSMPGLILARILQGLGGTMLAPASLALLGACFEGEARGKAIGSWSGWSAVTSTIGPVVGGIIIDHLGWRWVFFINVPIAIAVVAIALIHVPESRDEGESGPLDLFGSALVTLGLGGIVYAFVMSGLEGWKSATICAAVVGAGCLAAFVFTEARVRNPVLPLRLFANRAFTGINLMTFLLYGALGGLFYFLPFVMVQVDGYSSTVTGAAFLPFVGLMLFLSRLAGAMVYRIGPRWLLVAGPAIAGIGFCAFALLPDLHYWQGIFPGVMLVGAGMGLTVAPLTTTLMESVPEQHVGLASGINNALSRVAGLLAIAILGALLASVFIGRLDTRMNEQHLTPAQQQAVLAQRGAMTAARFHVPSETAALNAAYVDGFRAVALGCALLAALSAVTSGRMLPTVSRRPTG